MADREETKTDSYDVIIFERDTKKIEAFTGKDMVVSGRHFTVAKRLETTRGRINDLYDAAIIPAGKYKEGDILDESDIIEL